MIDSDGHVRAGYDATGGSLVLIRPDGYLGLVTNPGTAERINDYGTAPHGSPATRAAPAP